MNNKRIAILGSGANGTSIGVDLTRAGHDVALIDQWPQHVERMRLSGARVVMPEQAIHVPVRAYHLCDVCRFTERFDVVLVLVKAYDTRWACQLIEPYVTDDGLVVGVQNGMSTETVSEVVGPHRTLGCVIEISAMLHEPGIVERHSGPDRSWFAVGHHEPSTRGREHEIAELLRYSGAVDVVDDIRATKWMKLVSNCTTMAPTAILGLPIVSAAAIPEMRELMVRAGEEALGAGVAMGLPILPIFGLAADALGEPRRAVETLLDTLCAGFILPTSTTTVLHDWRKGRRSEVHEINGKVVAELRARGGEAPANAAIVEVARRIERGALAPDSSNLELLLHLADGGRPASGTT